MFVKSVLGAFGLSGPAGELVDLASEGMFGQSARGVLEDVKARLLAASGRLPANHDLDLAIRLAELSAALVVLDAYRRRLEGDAFDDRSARLPDFIDAAKAWVLGQIGLNPTLELKTDDALVAELDSALDETLSARTTDEQRAALAGAEATVWRNLVAAADAPTPKGFEAFFFGREEGQPGWSAYYAALIREALKSRPRAETTFVTDRLAVVVSRLRGFDERLNAMARDVAALRKLAEVEAARQGIAEGFIHEMAGRIAAAEGLDLEGKMQRVRKAIEIYADEIVAGLGKSNVDEGVDRALDYAHWLVNQGKSGLARAHLRDAAQNMRRNEDRRLRDASEKRERYLLAAVALYNRERDIALAVFDVDGAVEAIFARIEIVGSKPERFSAIASEAQVLYEHGRDRGSAVHLLVSAALWRQATDAASGTDERGRAQNNLGNALSTLGEHERGIEPLEEAIAAFRAALGEYTRERAPMQWASTQNNLGGALWKLGDRRVGIERLDEAVAAFDAALEVRTREIAPLLWATTRHNLGNVYLTLARREIGITNVTTAIAIFREVLLERSRERSPSDWADTQNSLGNALQFLGLTGSGPAILYESIAAYNAALEFITRERLPFKWATLRNNIGNTLRLLGSHLDDKDLLEKAISAYASSFQELTRERFPLAWAMTQSNLGVALCALGKREVGNSRLEESVSAFRLALQERTPERVPIDWAHTQNELGNALAALGERESGTARLMQAATAYRLSLQEFTCEQHPFDWAKGHNNLGQVLIEISIREDEIRWLKDAIAAFRLGIQSYTPYGALELFARISRNLSKTESLFAKRRRSR